MFRVLVVDDSNKMRGISASHGSYSSVTSKDTLAGDTCCALGLKMDAGVRSFLLTIESICVLLPLSNEQLSCIQIKITPFADSSITSPDIASLDASLALKAIKLFSEVSMMLRGDSLSSVRDLLKRGEETLSKLLASPALRYPDIPQFKAAFEYIEDNFRRPISLKDVARHVGYSPAYLTNAVHRLSGHSVNHWILLRRIDEACELLETTLLPVEQIALRVGYRSKSQLFRQFQKMHKMSPQQWRRHNAS